MSHGVSRVKNNSLIAVPAVRCGPVLSRRWMRLHLITWLTKRGIPCVHHQVVDWKRRSGGLQGFEPAGCAGGVSARLKPTTAQRASWASEFVAVRQGSNPGTCPESGSRVRSAPVVGFPSGFTSVVQSGRRLDALPAKWLFVSHLVVRGSGRRSHAAAYPCDRRPCTLERSHP